MLKITGLDELSKTFEDARKALQSIDGEFGAVNFDPNDPASIQAAIQKVDDLIDERLGPYASNPVIAPLAESTKEHLRQSIIESATAARLEGDQSS